MIPRTANRKSSGNSRRHNHLQERPLRIGVRQNHPPANLAPVLQYNAAGSPVANLNPLYRGRSPNLHAQFLPRRSQRLSNRSHPAHNVPIKPLQLVLPAAQQMKQQSDRRSRLVRPAMLAVNVVRQEHRFHLFGFVIVIEKLSQTPGKKRNQLRNLRARNPAKAFAHAKQVAPAAHRRRINLRRRLHKKRLQITRQLLQLIVDLDKPRRILRGYLSKLRFRPFTIHPPRNHLSIGEGNLNCRIARNHAQPMIGQAEFRNHLRPQHAGNIRSSRHPAARSNLLRHATSADNFTPLQHQRGKSAACQIRGRSQSVVAAADDDRVINKARSRFQD